MSHLNILTDPNKELRIIAEPVDVSKITTEEFQTFLDDMIETMTEENGIGLAGPQVANPKRVIVGVLDNQPYIFINPVITETSFLKIDSEEGCLSIPGVWGIVKRHKHITVDYYDRDGKAQTRKLKGLEGIVVQHETDHLNGVLFTDKVIRFTTPPELL